MAQTAVEKALAHIDAQIADLQRARAILVASDPPQAVVEKKPRKPRQKRGMPATDGEALKF